MAKKPKNEKPREDETRKKRESRDYSQRAHDVVREVEKRHEERHKDEPTDAGSSGDPPTDSRRVASADPDRWAITVATNMDHFETTGEIVSETEHDDHTEYVVAMEPKDDPSD